MQRRDRFLMQPRDRVFRVLNHEIPDYCPVLVRAMANNVQMKFVNNYDIQEEEEIFYWRDLTPLIGMKIDAFDFTIPTSQKNTIKLEDGKKVDPFGRISQNGAYTDGYLKTREIWKEWPPLELQNPNDPRDFKKMTEAAGDKIALFASLRGYFELVWEAMSLKVFARAQRKDISFIREILDYYEKYTYETAKQCLDEGIEFFSVTDDMGFKGGPFTAVKFYEENIFPRYQKLTNLIHKNDAKIYLHSEGNVTQLLPNIINAKFDGIQALSPPDGVDLAYIKENYGDKIALLGCLSHSPMLDMNTPDEVERMVKTAFNLAGKDGGLMLGPSAMIDKNCKIENILTMIKTIHSCKY